jgi:hypothetical protein
LHRSSHRLSFASRRPAVGGTGRSVPRPAAYRGPAAGYRGRDGTVHRGDVRPKGELSPLLARGS